MWIGNVPKSDSELKQRRLDLPETQSPFLVCFVPTSVCKSVPISGLGRMILIIKKKLLGEKKSEIKMGKRGHDSN